MDILSVDLFCIMLFFISFYGLISSKRVIKSIICICLMEMSVIMFFLGINYSPGIMPPIGTKFDNVADPLPQALMITAIIIGVAVTAVNLTMLISLCRQFRTADWDNIKD